MSSTLTVFGALKHLFPVPAVVGRRRSIPYPCIRPTDRRSSRRAASLSDSQRARLKCPNALARRDPAEYGNYRTHYRLPPLSPFDVFAVSAYLLELSGAYHHVTPELIDVTSGPVRAPAATGQPDVRRLLKVTHEEIRLWRYIARHWRKDPIPNIRALTHSQADRHIQTWLVELIPIYEAWDELFSGHGNAPVFDKVSPSVDPPPWWRVALSLFVIADEAARDVGFTPLFGQTMPWFQDWKYEEIRSKFLQWAGTDADEDSDGKAAAPDGAASASKDPDYAASEAEKAAEEQSIDESGQVEIEEFITNLSDAREDVVCVLPKARTTAVGCTMRSLSHHLALLPSRGIARANWVPHLFKDPPSDEREFNLLLVPYPYSINPFDFRPESGLAGVE